MLRSNNSTIVPYDDSGATSNKETNNKDQMDNMEAILPARKTHYHSTNEDIITNANGPHSEGEGISPSCNQEYNTQLSSSESKELTHLAKQRTTHKPSPIPSTVEDIINPEHGKHLKGDTSSSPKSQTSPPPVLSHIRNN